MTLKTFSKLVLKIFENNAPQRPNSAIDTTYSHTSRQSCLVHDENNRHGLYSSTY